MTSAEADADRSCAPAHPTILQIVLGSDDLPFAKHFWSTVFGFAPAGERLIYSRHNGEAMGLGEWGGATVLYMVGRQELLQLEFWNHTRPRQRPIAAGSRPDDLGFCRFGITIPDFDGVIERLEAMGVATITAPVEVNGLRRVCFIDPTVGIPVEIMEEGTGLPGTRDRYQDLKPAVAYVAVSVVDLDESVAFFADVVGLERTDTSLHDADDERLWELADARRRVATLRGGTTFLEIVEYETAAGRERPLKDGLDLQGFKTVAVGFRDPAETGRLFQRVKTAGVGWTVAQPLSFVGGNHMVAAVAHHMKTLSVPLELERQFGFSPETSKWWQPPSGAAEAHG